MTTNLQCLLIFSSSDPLAIKLISTDIFLTKVEHFLLLSVSLLKPKEENTDIYAIL